MWRVEGSVAVHPQQHRVLQPLSYQNLQQTPPASAAWTMQAEYETW